MHSKQLVCGRPFLGSTAAAKSFVDSFSVPSASFASTNFKVTLGSWAAQDPLGPTNDFSVDTSTFAPKGVPLSYMQVVDAHVPDSQLLVEPEWNRIYYSYGMPSNLALTMQWVNAGTVPRTSTVTLPGPIIEVQSVQVAGSVITLVFQDAVPSCINTLVHVWPGTIQLVHVPGIDTPFGLYLTDAAWKDSVVPGTGPRSIDIYSAGLAAALLGTPDVISAGSFVVGAWYTIVFIGTTDFEAVGALGNVVGQAFQATGLGSGDGVAAVFVMALACSTLPGPSELARVLTAVANADLARICMPSPLTLSITYNAKTDEFLAEVHGCAMMLSGSAAELMGIGGGVVTERDSRLAPRTPFSNGYVTLPSGNYNDLGSLASAVTTALNPLSWPAFDCTVEDAAGVSTTISVPGGYYSLESLTQALNVLFAASVVSALEAFVVPGIGIGFSSPTSPFAIGLPVRVSERLGYGGPADPSADVHLLALAIMHLPTCLGPHEPTWCCDNGLAPAPLDDFTISIINALGVHAPVSIASGFVSLSGLADALQLAVSAVAPLIAVTVAPMDRGIVFTSTDASLPFALQLPGGLISARMGYGSATYLPLAVTHVPSAGASPTRPCLDGIADVQASFCLSNDTLQLVASCANGFSFTGTTTASVTGVFSLTMDGVGARHLVPGTTLFVNGLYAIVLPGVPASATDPIFCLLLNGADAIGAVVDVPVKVVSAPPLVLYLNPRGHPSTLPARILGFPAITIEPASRASRPSLSCSTSPLSSSALYPPQGPLWRLMGTTRPCLVQYPEVLLSVALDACGGGGFVGDIHTRLDDGKGTTITYLAPVMRAGVSTLHANYEHNFGMELGPVGVRLGVARVRLLNIDGTPYATHGQQVSVCLRLVTV